MQAPESKIEPLKQSINVTDTISTDAPALITVVNKDKIESTPGIELDDRLRDVPGFSLFRRSSSLVANPTTQGVSLRGISSSGASRTLLLWDGIPENDPFGGWVYWDRFVPEQLERIEMSRGASTSVFGDLALGGVISVFSNEPTPRHIDLGYEGGGDNTNELFVTGSNIWRRFAISGAVRALNTDGYFIVPNTIRGAADTPAGVEFVAGNVRFDYLGARDRFFLRLDMLAEHRANGTNLTTNSTGLGSLGGNYSHEWLHDQVSVLGYYTSEGFHSSFTSVAAGRATERYTSLQTVPSSAEGGAFLWNHRESRWSVLGGADVERVEGTSTDHLFPSGSRVGGGVQLEHGVFAQVNYRVGSLQLFGGTRYQVGRVNPSAGLAWGRSRFRAHGAVYKSFRTPTLNELYRDFRVGNTDTQPNANLRPETLFGSEAGVEWYGESTHIGVTAFRNDLNGLITNVTLSSSGGSIIRQRQNASNALSRGLETTFRQNWGNFRGEASYLYVHSQYAAGPMVPQVPRHQGSADIVYQRHRTYASFGVRSYSYQFDDDVNHFLLPGFAVVELAGSQQITHGFSVHGAIDNLLNHQYLVALTPTPNLGEPRLWRVGLRWSH